MVCYPASFDAVHVIFLSSDGVTSAQTARQQQHQKPARQPAIGRDIFDFLQ
jgi:hypothetical protein